MDWLVYVVGNFWFWVVGVPVLAVAATDITKRIIRHRERMAMIRHGMDPDRRRATSPATYPATPPAGPEASQPAAR